MESIKANANNAKEEEKNPLPASEGEDIAAEDKTLAQESSPAPVCENEGENEHSQADIVQERNTDIEISEAEENKQEQAHNAQENENEGSDSNTENADGEKAVQVGERVGKSEEQRLREELERERALRLLSENKLLCIALLEEHGLPITLSECLTSTSEEQTRKCVEDVSKAVKKAVSDELSRRLTGIPTPTEGKSAMTRAQFNSLSLSERQRLYLTDKELYNELTKKI